MGPGGRRPEGVGHAASEPGAVAGGLAGSPECGRAAHAPAAHSFATSARPRTGYSRHARRICRAPGRPVRSFSCAADLSTAEARIASPAICWAWERPRSEEHTSELQSLMRISYAVFCLKKKKRT